MVIENKIKTWLEQVFDNEDYQDIAVDILGNSDKGDGYVGDIVFASANMIEKDKSTKKYDLVLKSSKNSKALRETSPVKDAFLNEIHFYEKVLPYFEQFQKEKRAQVFDSVPKNYGFVTGDNHEIIVFENLKKKGYELWPKKIGMTKKHIEMVLTEYGKFHATSLALQLQQPRKFQALVDGGKDVFRKFCESSNLENVFKKPLLESCELLKTDLDENILSKWKDFSNKAHYIFYEMPESITGLKVILHGDCWNNNFMFLHDKSNNLVPLKVALLDWQISQYSTPVFDLSYFLFACVSENDLNNLDELLNVYYQVFTEQLRQLNVENPQQVYPQTQFHEEWKNYSKYGIMMASMIMKIASTEKDEVVDIAQMAESGKDFTEAFQYEVKDKETFKNRIRPIVEYTVNHNLL